MDKKTIIDKVIKLLAMAKDNCNENESNVAKNKAAKLMADYNISNSEMAKNGHIQEHKIKLNRKAPIKYDSQLTAIISMFNGVVYIQSRDMNKAVNLFVGSKVDIGVNNYMLDIIYQQRNQKWKEHLAEIRKQTTQKLKDSVKHNWMKGFAFGVSDKLDELSKLADDYTAEMGIVPINTYDQVLSIYQKDNPLKIGPSRSLSYSASGREAGRKTAIHKGVKQQTGTKLI